MVSDNLEPSRGIESTIVLKFEKGWVFLMVKTNLWTPTENLQGVFNTTSDASDGQAVCWSFAAVNVWLLGDHLSRGYFQTMKRVAALRKTSFKVCSCVGFVLHWFQRMLININHLVLRHLTKAYNHATTSAVSDWEVPRLSRVLRVRSPLFASWEVETSCILKFERKKESVKCFIK